MMAAMTDHKVVSAQLTQGATDAQLFCNFMYRTLQQLRKGSATCDKRIVVVLDNASIHKTQEM